MPRKKSATALDQPPTDSDDGRLDQLTSAVDTLAQEVRVLREAVDELREILDWTMKNREPPANHEPFPPITSLPPDPIAKDFGENINQTKPEELPSEPPESTSVGSGELF